MIEEKEARKLAREWIEAWNERDLERILSHYAEDVVFTSPFAIKLAESPNGTIKGKAALRDYFAKGLENFPKLHFELVEVLAGVASVTLYYKSVQNRLAAEVMELGPKGLVIRVMAHYTPGGAALAPR